MSGRETRRLSDGVYKYKVYVRSHQVLGPSRHTTVRVWTLQPVKTRVCILKNKSTQTRKTIETSTIKTKHYTDEREC